MRWMCYATMLAALVVVSSARASTVRDCLPADINSADGRIASVNAESHQLFHLHPIVYERPTPIWPPLVVTIVVGTDGTVECMDPFGAIRDQLGGTPQRRAILDTIGNWRYRPFEAADAPVRAVVKVTIPEKVKLASHEDMPRVPVSASTLTLRRGGYGLGAMPQYTVTVRGNGDVDFNSTGGTDVVGHYRYQIAPHEVAALIDRLRTKDVWSAAGRWYTMVTDSPDATMTMTFGDQTHVITDHVGEGVGMPHAVTEAENDIDATAHTVGLVHLSADGLGILDQNHFDFKSNAGANLLMRAIVDRNVSNDTVMAVLDRAAPIEGGNPSGILPWKSPPGRAVDAALAAGRTPVARRLIAAGGLLTDDKPDQARVDRAFQDAVRGGSFEMVKAIWTYHPSLTYLDTNVGEGITPAPADVILLTCHFGNAKDFPESTAIAGFLIDNGSDVNTRSASTGASLLQCASVTDDQIDLVDLLIKHGAKVNTVDVEHVTPLTGTFSEAVALRLLEAGADPNLQAVRYRNIFYRSRQLKWFRVIEWLKAHGYAAQLEANPPE